MSTTERIIPARAGFTPHAPSQPHSRPDHPRSRGVYTVAAGSAAVGPGSSPLARGLRRLPLWALAVIRIIPARAGFTCDHPPD